MWKDNNVFVLQDSEVHVPISPTPLTTAAKLSGKSAVLMANLYAAVWQDGADGAVTILGVLPGDFAAFATGINNRGQVVGNNFDSNNWSHGFIWQNGVMTDLNTLIPADSNLFIISASNINERGQISGMATVQTGPHAGDIHSYLLTPTDGPRHLDGRFRTYTYAFHFSRECWQPLFAETRTRPIAALTGIFGANARCIPGLRCAKAQRRMIEQDILGHVNIDVTQNVYRKKVVENVARYRK